MASLYQSINRLLVQTAEHTKYITYIKQDHQALLKAKYCPRVAAASCTQKNTKILTLLTFHGLRIYEIYLNNVNCTKHGHSILRKIIKIVGTICHTFRLKCTKFYFGWGSAPDPAGRAYSAPPDSLAGFQLGAYV